MNQTYSHTLCTIRIHVPWISHIQGVKSRGGEPAVRAWRWWGPKLRCLMNSIDFSKRDGIKNVKNWSLFMKWLHQGDFPWCSFPWSSGVRWHKKEAVLFRKVPTVEFASSLARLWWWQQPAAGRDGNFVLKDPERISSQDQQYHLNDYVLNVGYNSGEKILCPSIFGNATSTGLNSQESHRSLNR